MCKENELPSRIYFLHRKPAVGPLEWVFGVVNCLVVYLKTLPVAKNFASAIRVGQIVGGGSARLNIPSRAHLLTAPAFLCFICR